MSNYSRAAWNPKEKVVRAAMWMDDYFGQHQYGVAFEGDPNVYQPADVEIPLDLVLVPQPPISSASAQSEPTSKKA